LWASSPEWLRFEGGVVAVAVVDVGVVAERDLGWRRKLG